MLFAILFFSGLNFLMVAFIVFRMKTYDQRYESLITRLGVLEALHRARMGNVKKPEKRTAATPPIDAKARTTKRDTDDLPPTGRMSTGIHRRRSDVGSTDDS